MDDPFIFYQFRRHQADFLDIFLYSIVYVGTKKTPLDFMLNITNNYISGSFKSS